jgi:hypothetical protein
MIVGSDLVEDVLHPEEACENVVATKKYTKEHDLVNDGPLSLNQQIQPY